MRNPFESPAPISQADPSVEIENYLDHLCAPLLRKTTYTQRLYIREEVSAHLLVLAAGHEELGSSPEEAIRAAMHQFGNPRKIGRSLSGQYRKPFAFNERLLWVLLHAALGGSVASLVLIALDCMFWAARLDAHTAILGDCLIGMASGWIPGVQLLRRPASPWRAGLRMGGFYAAAMTPWMIFSIFACGRHHEVKDLLFGLCVVSLTGVGQAVGGAVLSRLFQHLQSFAPRPRTRIAR